MQPIEPTPINHHVLFGDEDEQSDSIIGDDDMWRHIFTLYGQLRTTLEIAAARFYHAEIDVAARHELAGNFDELELYARQLARYLRFAPTRRQP